MHLLLASSHCRLQLARTALTTVPKIHLPLFFWRFSHFVETLTFLSFYFTFPLSFTFSGIATLLCSLAVSFLPPFHPPFSDPLRVDV